MSALGRRQRSSDARRSGLLVRKARCGGYGSRRCQSRGPTTRRRSNREPQWLPPGARPHRACSCASTDCHSATQSRKCCRRIRVRVTIDSAVAGAAGDCDGERVQDRRGDGEMRGGWCDGAGHAGGGGIAGEGRGTRASALPPGGGADRTREGGLSGRPVPSSGARSASSPGCPARRASGSRA
jgi:hypothetical protein